MIVLRSIGAILVLVVAMAIEVPAFLLYRLAEKVAPTPKPIPEPQPEIVPASLEYDAEARTLVVRALASSQQGELLYQRDLTDDESDEIQVGMIWTQEKASS